MHVGQLQLDELYVVLRALKAGELSEDQAIQRLEHSPSWGWTAMDPESKLLLVIDVGTRTLATAQRVVHRVVKVLAPGCVPLFLTDGFKEYTTAILAHFGQWIQPERRQDKGPRVRYVSARLGSISRVFFKAENAAGMQRESHLYEDVGQRALPGLPVAEVPPVAAVEIECGWPHARAAMVIARMEKTDPIDAVILCIEHIAHRFGPARRPASAAARSMIAA